MNSTILTIGWPAVPLVLKRFKLPLLGLLWGSAALLWAAYSYAQSALRGGPPLFERYLVASAVIFSFWLAITPLVGRLAGRLPVYGSGSRRNLLLHSAISLGSFPLHIGWLMLVAPTAFTLFGWDIYSAYYARLDLAGLFFNGRGLLDIALYWVILLGYTAVDYHRKYLERDSLANRLATRLAEAERAMQPPGPDSIKWLTRIPIKTAEKSYLLNTADIDWIEAADSYVIFKAGGRNHLLRDTMKRIEQNLDPAHFFRVHRRIIVNIDRIKEIRPGEAGDFVIIMPDRTELPLSRRRRRGLEKVLGREI